MAQLAQAKVQETTSSTLSGLLASYKSNMGATGASSNLFASLLNEAGSSMPVVEAYDPSSSASAARNTQTTTSRDARDTTSPTSSDKSGASARESRAQTSAADKPVASKAKASSQDDDNRDVAASDSEPAQVAQDKVGVDDKDKAATDQDHVDAAASDAQDDTAEASAAQAEAQVAAMMVPTAAPESCKRDGQTDKKDEAAETKLTTDGQGALAAQNAGLTNTPVTDEAVHEKKSKAVSKGATQNVQKAAAETNDTAQLAEQAASAADEGKASAPQKTEQSKDSELEASQYTKMVDAASTAKVGENTASQQGNQQEYSDLLKGQDRQTTQTTTSAPATASVQASTTQVTEGLADSATQAASGVKSVQSLTGLSGGVRPAGSYDFASQLSAARVTKGGSTGLPQAVEQVSVQLHKAAKDGIDEITIQLRPAELGKIEVKLEIAADKTVKGTIVADNQATLNMLQKDSSSLQHALQEAGLQADSGSLQFSLRDDNQANNFAQNQTASGAQRLSASESGSDVEGDDLGALSTVNETYYLTPGRVNLRV